ncbi:MAG: CinA family protein, partial [Clostridiales bacterium]|nr:CinA family protein [Clostridiales bacterium]
MASGAAKILSADIAISVTGIAGPGGDMPGKPVGTVFMGIYN